MNRSFTRTEIWITLLEAALLSLIALSWIWMSEAKAAFNDCTQNEQDCQRLVSEIETLQKMGAVATEDRSDSDFGNAALIKIAVACGMSENQLTSLRRHATLQIDGTDYRQQDLSVVLREVSLEQLLRFAIQVENQHDSVKTTAINLINGQSLQRQRRIVKPTAAKGEKDRTNDPTEKWNAELILTQLAYVATSATR